MLDGMQLLDGLQWFVMGGVAVGILIAWAKAMDLASGGGISAVVRGVGTFLICCGLLAIIVWLDIRSKVP